MVPIEFAKAHIAKIEEDMKIAKQEATRRKKEFWSLFERLLAPSLVPDWLVVVKKSAKRRAASPMMVCTGPESACKSLPRCDGAFAPGFARYYSPMPPNVSASTSKGRSHGSPRFLLVFFATKSKKCQRTYIIFSASRTKKEHRPTCLVPTRSSPKLRCARSSCLHSPIPFRQRTTRIRGSGISRQAFRPSRKTWSSFSQILLSLQSL